MLLVAFSERLGDDMASEGHEVGGIRKRGINVCDPALHFMTQPPLAQLFSLSPAWRRGRGSSAGDLACQRLKRRVSVVGRRTEYKFTAAFERGTACIAAATLPLAFPPCALKSLVDEEDARRKSLLSMDPRQWQIVPPDGPNQGAGARRPPSMVPAQLRRILSDLRTLYRDTKQN